MPVRSEPEATRASGGESDVKQGKVPWICPRCGHFLVRATAEYATHRCVGQDDDVELIPYLSSEQAEAIRRSRGRG